VLLTAWALEACRDETAGHPPQQRENRQVVRGQDVFAGRIRSKSSMTALKLLCQAGNAESFRSETPVDLLL